MEAGTSIEIRDAVLSDAEGIARVDIDAHLEAYRHIFGDGYMAGATFEAFVERWRGVLNGTAPRGRAPEHLLVADTEGEVIGYTGFGRCRDEDAASLGEVYAIYVHPSRWRSGTGRLLMVEALARLAALGHGEVCLWALEANDVGRGFYEHEGWRLDGATRTPPHGQVEVRYRLRIPWTG